MAPKGDKASKSLETLAGQGGMTEFTLVITFLAQLNTPNDHYDLTQGSMVSFDLESALALALDRTLVLSCSGLRLGKELVIGKYP